MLLNPLDSILGTTTKVRLLRALVPLDRPVSGREAARLAGVSHIALRALEELAGTGVLDRAHTVGQHLFTFNRDHFLAPAIGRLFAEERRYTAAVFDRLREIVDATGPVEAAAVIGSAARGEDAPGSDLDVLVLVRDHEVRDMVHQAISDSGPEFEKAFGLRLSPIVTTLDQFRRQKRDEDPFVSAVRRDGRRVCGAAIEDLMDG